MGWTWEYDSTRGSMIADLTRDQALRPAPDGTPRKRRCIAKCYKGSSFKGTLYAVFQDFAEGQPERPEDRWIAVYLLAYWRMDGKQGWAYKDMEESCGPCEVGCPQKYLELAPKVACASWRAAVTAYNARLSDARTVLRELRDGDRVYLKNANMEYVHWPRRGIPRRLIDVERTRAWAAEQRAVNA